MPFNVKCGACGHMIAKGVRFNAEKRKIGKYHSTPIWSFTMHSACCSQEIEVQTDPAKTEYNVTKGARTTFELNALSKARWKEDYDVNKSLRRSMRGRRKEEHALRDHARALGLPEHVKLEPERDEDKEYARRVFNASVFERNRKQKRKDILSESIFADKQTRPKPAAKRTSSASSNHSRAAKLAKRR
jgi:coiled-coil domain-containing protein 130